MVPVFSDVQVEVDKGLQLLAKYKKAVADNGIPGFYVRALARYLDSLNALEALSKSNSDFRGSIPKDNFKAFDGALRFAKKTLGSGAIAALIGEYRADPKAERWMDPAAKAELSDDESNSDDKPTVSGPKRGTREFWVKQPGDTSSESEGGDDSWLNDSAESGDDEAPKKDKKDKAKPGAKSKKHKVKTVKAADDDEDGDDAEPEEPVVRAAPEPMEEESVLRSEDVDRLMLEMSMLRGRKGTDYKRLLQRLELILPKAFTDVQRVRLLLLFINSRFDSVRSTKARLSADHWRAAANDIATVLKLLRANANYRLVEVDDSLMAADEELISDLDPEEGIGGPVVVDAEEKRRKQQKKKEKAQAAAADTKAAGRTVISGSLFSLLDRLDSALLRTLQQIDPHTQEYVTRLADEPLFVGLAKDMLAYQLSIGEKEEASKVSSAGAECVFVPPSTHSHCFFVFFVFLPDCSSHHLAPLFPLL